MRTPILVSLIFLITACAALRLTTAPGAREIIEVNATKDELFTKADQWMIKVLNNKKSVIQLQDNRSGRLMGKYLLHEQFGIASQYGFIQQSPDAFAVITIFVKANRTKIIVEPQGSWKSMAGGKNVGYGDTYGYTTEKAEADIKALMDSYRNWITTK